MAIEDQLADPEIAADPLRHYRCARKAGTDLIVGNGDHVDVLADAIVAGSTGTKAAQLLEPEPDPPFFTPRIDLVVGDVVRLIAVRRSGSATERLVEDAAAAPSSAVVLTTYSGSVTEPEGAAPMLWAGEDRPITALAEAIWEALDPSLRVAMVAGNGADPRPILDRSENL